MKAVLFIYVWIVAEILPYLPTIQDFPGVSQSLAGRIQGQHINYWFPNVLQCLIRQTFLS